MSARVYASQLEAADLIRLLAELRAEAPFAVVERIDRLAFPAQDAPIDPLEWEHGRLFGPKVELRWEASEGRFRGWLTRTDGQAPPTGFELCRDFEGYEAEECDYLLRREGREVNLSRPLHYEALEPGERPAYLKVEEFYDQAGRLVYYRCVEMHRR